MKDRKAIVPFVFLAGVAVAALFVPWNGSGASTAEHVYETADVAWMLTAAALVLLMTPGLSFFYGGMVNRGHVISTMAQSLVSMSVISILWVVLGFGLAFGESIGGFIGNPFSHFMFKGVLDGKPWSLAPTIPLALFALFQLKFAIITPALITGAFAERIRFTSYVLFICLFSIMVYAPMAHWTWHPEGFLFKMGVLDFAGGTVVHIAAGVSALVAAYYLKGRQTFIEQKPHEPANIPYVILGTGLLWFGWFGFNAGSAMGANTLAVSAFATTNTASAAAAMAWIFMDAMRGKKPSSLGLCIGAVVGLVAITPGAGFVSVPASIFIGVMAAIISNIAAEWRINRHKVDDTLDVFPCHGVGGISGMLLTGIFASKGVNAAVVDQGLFFGETKLFMSHIAGLVIVIAFSGVGAWVCLKVTDLISPLRVSQEEEAMGLDLSQHGESMP